MADVPASIARRLEALTYDERRAAWLHIDHELILIGAGGHLRRYGLAGLRFGEKATAQAVFLEGLLPLAETPYHLPSIEIGNGRVADLHFHEDHDAVWVILL